MSASEKLSKKYKNNESFREEMDEAQEKYNRIVQQAIYSDLSLIPENILEKFYSPQIDIFFYYGYLQTAKHFLLKKLRMHFFKNFQKIYKPFIFVYFNNVTSSNEYNEFREIFLMLTLDHLINLQQFIVVKSTFMIRAFEYITFGAINKYLKEKTIYIDNAKQLCQRLKIDPVQFIQFVPETIYHSERQSFPYIEKRPININDHRINISGQQRTQAQKEARTKQEEELMSFMIPSKGKETFALEDYDVSEIGIPSVLKMLIFYFHNNPSGLLEEGIFRKSVSIDEENEALAELNMKNYECLEKITNPHIVANLIKRFFSKLITPIIPYQQFQSLMHDQGIADKKQHIKNVIHTLPRLNLATLVHLLLFLKDQVIVRESSNKMTVQNISICFSPCLMRAEKISNADLIYASKTVIVTKILLNDFQQIFGNRNQVKNLYRKSYAQHRKIVRNTIQGIQQVHMNKIQQPMGSEMFQESSKVDNQFEEEHLQQLPIVIKRTKTENINTIRQIQENKDNNYKNKVKQQNSNLNFSDKKYNKRKENDQ